MLAVKTTQHHCLHKLHMRVNNNKHDKLFFFHSMALHMPFTSCLIIVFFSVWTGSRQMFFCCVILEPLEPSVRAWAVISRSDLLLLLQCSRLHVRQYLDEVNVTHTMSTQLYASISRCIYRVFFAPCVCVWETQTRVDFRRDNCNVVKFPLLFLSIVSGKSTRV